MARLARWDWAPWPWLCCWAFVLIDRRSPDPLVRLSIFRIRALAVADGSLLLVASGMFGMFFFASL